MGMGCMPSVYKKELTKRVNRISWESGKLGVGETVVEALSRLDNEIASSERTQPTARLAVVTAEIDSLRQEINAFHESKNAVPSVESYAKTIHQVFVSLDIYRRPILAAENEDFIANVNRKELRRLELYWLRARLDSLQRERQQLHAQILRTRALYAQLHHLLDSVWSTGFRPGLALESQLSKCRALRDALSSVSARLRAAAECAHAAVQQLDDALPAWKLVPIGKSGWERTLSCADACSLLLRARCSERGARRVLAAPAAPRAARALTLGLDYAFTDALHDHKYQRATETFLQFKDALVLLINSIHQVLLNNLENLSEAEKDVTRYRKELRAVRVNAIVQRGLAELKYEPRALTSLRKSS